MHEILYAGDIPWEEFWEQMKRFRQIYQSKLSYPADDFAAILTT